AYTNILLAQRLIRVQEQAVERAELNLSSAKGFVDVGTQPLSTAVRAEVDVANAKVDLINARNALRTARVALNTALAIDASTQTEIRDNLEYEPTTIDRAALRTEALRQSPEYRQARLQSAAAEAGVQHASRNFLPNISGTGSYGGSQLELNPTWSLGVVFSWNIFDGGNLIAAHDEAKANLGAANARVKVAELTLIQNLEQAEIAVEAAQERIQAARVLIAAVCVAGWLAISAFFSFAVAPLAFRTIDRTIAGQLVAAVLPRYYDWGVVLCAIALTASAVLAVSGRTPRWRALAGVALCAAMVCLLLWAS